MHNLIERIETLKADPIAQTVEERIAQFEAVREESDEQLFSELCFCLLTANYASEPAMRIQREVGDGFLDLSEPELAARLRSLGYRFPNVRAGFIVEARKHLPELRRIVYSQELADEERRDWLVANVKGLGMKEASHFLRNVGVFSFAIVDFHIVDVLAAHGIIPEPERRSMTPKRYREVERAILEIGERTGLDMGRLDCYLWYLETGNVLK